MGDKQAGEIKRREVSNTEAGGMTTQRLQPSVSTAHAEAVQNLGLNLVTI